jgi:ABC-type histidine transport system ATPase subunit
MKGCSEQQRFQKATAILKRALNPDDIIFELPKSKMDPDSAVEEIVSQLGEIAGYTNLGLHYLKAASMLLELFLKHRKEVKGPSQTVSS